MAEDAGKEAPGAGCGQLDQILESIISLASSFALLKAQPDREQQLLQQRMRHVAPLSRAPTRSRQAGMTRTIQQGSNILPTAPAQARGTPTFQLAPTLALVQRTCDTMAGVLATAPDPSVPGFPGIYTLLEDRANTTPRLGL